MINKNTKWISTITLMAMLLAALATPLTAAFAKDSSAATPLLDAKFHKLTPTNTQMDVDPHYAYLSWTPFEGADRYKFCIHEDIDPTTDKDGCGVGDPNWTGTFNKYYIVTNLNPNVTYEWTVMASTCWKKGCNEWKEADRGIHYTFTTKGDPADPPSPASTVIISGNTQVGGARIQFKWDENSDGDTDDAGEVITEYSKSNGKYSITIPYNVTGTLIPREPANSSYSFQPRQVVYSSPITTNQINVDFKAFAPIIVSGSTGVSGTTVTFTGWSDFLGSIKTTVTGSDGKYSVKLPYAWTGAISASKAGYTFDPAIYGKAPIKVNITNLNFTGSVAP